MSDVEDMILRIIKNRPGVTSGGLAVLLGGVPIDFVNHWPTLHSMEERSLVRHEWKMQEGAWTRCWFPGPVCR